MTTEIRTTLEELELLAENDNSAQAERFLEAYEKFQEDSSVANTRSLNKHRLNFVDYLISIEVIEELDRDRYLTDDSDDGGGILQDEVDEAKQTSDKEVDDETISPLSDEDVGEVE